jgi:hypothetical protein
MTGGSAMSYIRSKEIEYFSEETCQRIQDKIERITLEDTKEMKKAHIDYLRNKHN